ncbi:hypothetical protein IM40_10115 (plasmid) [Candidatus Paracaedimonas acanthamoebae]|nr:hypothetical protein IM40_10115 [Candidatus Paracaedimonas acanthamoebae]
MLRKYFLTDNQPVKQRFFRFLSNNNYGEKIEWFISLDLYKDQGETLHVLITYPDGNPSIYSYDIICEELSKIINASGYPKKETIFYILSPKTSRQNQIFKVILGTSHTKEFFEWVNIEEVPFNLEKYQHSS